MMYQRKRTCSRARGRLAWGCSSGDAMYTMSLHFMIKLLHRSLRIEKRHPKALKVQEKKNKREREKKKIYICVYK